MSMCKTGCGREATEAENRLCASCNQEWWDSPEWNRWDVGNPNTRAQHLSALTDFCSRIRAYRQNGSLE